MAYESLDKLQKILAEDIFSHTKDSKKAAGRALGTLVEIITFYFLKTWGLNNQISIERGLAEYGNSNITHNVEYSLHPILRCVSLTVSKQKGKPITASSIFKELKKQSIDFDVKDFKKTNNYLLHDNEKLNVRILRNACTIAISKESYLLCSIETEANDEFKIQVYEQHKKPYTVFECKRVGVEEGMTKGPQTIEKAKQGAYVARTASSLQKIWSEKGEMQGILYKSDDTYIIEPYASLMKKIIDSTEKDLLRKFILTVGIVSNHGNWVKKTEEGHLNFSEENFQKELVVLAQSYDWLLFLSDKGLSDFINELLLSPADEQKLLRTVFLSSYAEGKTKNQFTKVQMNVEADRILLDYFAKNITTVESWFNVISPSKKDLTALKQEIGFLKNKNWTNILYDSR